MRSETRAWLDRPELARLWDRLRDRLERNGLRAQGRLRLEAVTAAESEAVSLLLGRPCTGSVVSFELADLDDRLRSGAAETGLVDVVAELRGELTDRRARNHERRSVSARLWSAADEALRAHGVDGTGWANAWLEEIRRGGALARVRPEQAETLLLQAVNVLAELDVPARLGLDAGPATGPSTRVLRVGRGELAARVTGSAHGLDDDTLLSRLVLRGLARVHDAPFPPDAPSRRELWEKAGVATDRVSGTVLTFGLTPLGDDLDARWLRERSAAGAETHLTLRDLHRMSWRLPPETEVFVCENPRVVEAAADRGAGRPVVCLSGNPSSTGLALLDALIGARALLCYRGDFDWPGLAIANRVISRYGARPWRMGAADYEAHVAIARKRGTPLPPLAGEPVEASWDVELTPAMLALGVAVHEETVLELLVGDLRAND
ncbi:TIGR02679 family protein [Spirillospora sp. NPDC049652]